MGDCGRARYLPSLIALLSLFVQPLHICRVGCIGVQFDGTYNCTCRPRHNHNGGAVNMRGWHAFARSVQTGTHWLVLVFHSQPQSLGFGMLGILESDCFQIKAAAKRARLACWNKACWVGGIESSDFRLCGTLLTSRFSHISIGSGPDLDGTHMGHGIQPTKGFGMTICNCKARLCVAVSIPK